MSLTPDAAAQTSAALSARGAAQAQAMSQPLNHARIQANGQAPKMPEKSFGKILESLTPEKAAAAGMSPEAQKTLTAQAMNKRFAPGPSEEKKLREACEGFESVFIGQMLKEMRKTVQKDGLLHGKEEDQYVAMFDEELSKTLTKQGGMGLADFMQQQLATRAGANAARPVPPAEAGLRRSASDTMALAAPGKPMQRSFRDKGLAPLQAAGSLQGHAVVLASDAVRPGMRPNADSSPASPDSLAQKPKASLAGTPSQHLGTPGAQYLQGKDAQLAAAGQFISPVSGEVTSEYGWRRDPFTGQRAWHGGMDIAAPEGTPVRAARDGTVVFSGRERGYGNLVVVEHEGGVRTYYGHNKANEVTEGQSVKAGQVLAQVGQTGRATGPHLHFEVRVDGRSVDPASQGGARLAAATGPEIQVPVL
ncbi:MAG: peptidoglycan DD-metalloendopeptidase family protein [Acidobacteriota bacterium]